MSNSGETRSSRDRLSDKTFNWVLMEIVGPILIILMVGALVFFLIEVFYRGPHALRLGWVLGLFTAASVLVSKISIAEGLERAAIFGFALAAATLYVTVTLVDFEYGALFFLEPIVVGMLIAVVMWSSNRLTWDCTVIDSSRDVSSIGLSELVRRKLFKRGQTKTSESSQQQDTNEVDGEIKLERSGFQRVLFMFFANAKNQNTPGLWVFYFAIAAFPIFGFGQWFARASEDWGYRWIFMLFAIYLGSALGLLMLTSLLGLERYLRKRGAVMPASVSRAWMVIGTVFALGVMLLMMLLPSPSLSNGLQDTLGFLTTNSKETSKNAFGKDGQDEGENPRAEKQDQNAKGAPQKSGEKGAGDGDKGKGGDGKSDKKGKDSGGDKKSNEKSDSSKSDSKDSSQDKKSDSNDGKKSQQDQKQDGNDEKRGEQQDKQDENEQEDEKDAAGGEKNPQEQKDPKDDQANKRGNKGANQNNAQPPKHSNASTSRIAKFIGTLMKYIVYIGGLIAVVVLGWMFRDELAKLWREFFGKSDKSNKPDGAPQTQLRSKVRMKMNFSQFSNPFNNGFADKWPPAVTLQYTFEALEAWGRGHQIDRQADQTPHEFAKEIRQVDEGVAAEARRLADLLGQSLYSGFEVERTSIAGLKTMWQRMLANPPRATAPADLQPALVAET